MIQKLFFASGLTIPSVLLLAQAVAPDIVDWVGLWKQIGPWGALLFVAWLLIKRLFDDTLVDIKVKDKAGKEQTETVPKGLLARVGGRHIRFVDETADTQKSIASTLAQMANRLDDHDEKLEQINRTQVEIARTNAQIANTQDKIAAQAGELKIQTLQVVTTTDEANQAILDKLEVVQREVKLLTDDRTKREAGK